MVLVASMISQLPHFIELTYMTVLIYLLFFGPRSNPECRLYVLQKPSLSLVRELDRSAAFDAISETR